MSRQSPTRPHFNRGIKDLEALYERSKEDPPVLEQLAAELRHRKTMRAKKLAERVRQSLEKMGSSGERRQAVKRGSKPSSKRERSRAPRAAASRSPTPPVASPPARPPVSEAKPSVPVAAGTEESAREAEQQVSAPEIDSKWERMLAAWTSLEVLTPQRLMKPGELRAAHRQGFRSDEEPEPWAEPSNAARGREDSIYWWVHLGEIDIGRATDSLLRAFPDEASEERVVGKGATTMAVVVLDETGVPVEDKTFLSSFAWGCGVVRSGELESLARFSQVESALRREIESRLVRMDEEGEPMAVTADLLASTTRHLVQRLNLPVDEVWPGWLTVRVPVYKSFADVPEPELLNSFYLDDLTRVRQAVGQEDVGKALARYLSGRPDRSRSDVIGDRHVVEQTVAPSRIPLSRWPIRGGYPLSLMQQAAVNHASEELEERGLIGVNGPPGTGKTTLLRDVIAKVVLDRAVALARFEDPNDAFTHVTSLRLGRGFGHLYALDETLLGHEIVVASSNNKAVENISREIPALDAIDDRLDPPPRYFASVADAVASREPVEESCWGLAAAVLGNAANRRVFKQRFWWDEQRGMMKYLRTVADGWEPEGSDREEFPESVWLEEPPLDAGDALRRWQESRERFNAALAAADALRQELEAARSALREREELVAELARLRLRCAELDSRLAVIKKIQEAEQRRFDGLQRQEQEEASDQQALREVRPGFFARLFRTASYKGWLVEFDAASERLRSAREARRQQEAKVGRVADDVAATEERLAQEQRRVDQLAARHSAIERQLEGTREWAGGHVPEAAFWTGEKDEIQKSSPWLPRRFNAARDAVFAASFDLHRAFIEASAGKLRHNLALAMNLLEDRVLNAKQEPARRSIWASLFLVVPVISTTFASTSRLFGPLGREQIGWLLVDEAGQTTPQAATGAIWRAERVIGIGDPIQLQPVVPTSDRLINALFEVYGVSSDEWAAPANSVQSLADAASWFGTTIGQGEGGVWVGAPLCVHRRCEEPMFSISNHVGYNGLMVQATRPAESEIGRVLGASGWFDLEASAIGKWAAQEGEIALEMLHRLFDSGVDEPDVFFITPFRIVMQRLRELIRRDGRAREHLPDLYEWTSSRVGTIHVFQGKEAEAVVLVLGAPAPESSGARFWAGGTPNLLNVAVSRAKQRLYVVGHHEAWKQAGVFRTLSAKLPRVDAAEWRHE